MGKFKVFPIKIFVKQIGPGYVQLFFSTSVGNLVILQTTVPIEPHVQRLTHHFYGPRFMAPIAKISAIGESIMVRKCVFLIEIN